MADLTALDEHRARAIGARTAQKTALLSYTDAVWIFADQPTPERLKAVVDAAFAHAELARQEIALTAGLLMEAERLLGPAK